MFKPNERSRMYIDYQIYFTLLTKVQKLLCNKASLSNGKNLHVNSNKERIEKIYDFLKRTFEWLCLPDKTEFDRLTCFYELTGTYFIR